MIDDVKRVSRATSRGAQRVARTEAKVMDAAQSLFIEHGYVPTTLAQVAERAGVAGRTVYVRFKTKANLFTRLVDRALVGDIEPIDVEHRPRTQEAMAADTLSDRIAALADVSVGIANRAGALFELAAQAEGLEPEIRQAAQNGRDATAQLATTFWRRAADDGLLDASLDPDHLALATDILICADTVVHLWRTHGWSAPAHRALIIDTLTALARPPHA